MVKHAQYLPSSSRSSSTQLKDESDIAQQARAIDISYLVTRQIKETRPSWSAFNQSLSKCSAESAAITTVG